jgi:hypothetical protein
MSTSDGSLVQECHKTKTEGERRKLSKHKYTQREKGHCFKSTRVCSGSEVWSVTVFTRDKGDQDSDIERQLLGLPKPAPKAPGLPPNRPVSKANRPKITKSVFKAVAEGVVHPPRPRDLYRRGDIVWLKSEGLLWPCWVWSSSYNSLNTTGSEGQREPGSTSREKPSNSTLCNSGYILSMVCLKSCNAD